jgi:hypothetical protein
MELPKTTALVPILLAALPGAAQSLDFRDAYFRHADFRHADFRDADERNGTAMGPGVSPLWSPLEKGWVRGSGAAFYLGDGVDPGQCLDDGPRRIDIEYLWSIPAEASASVTLKKIRRTVAAPSPDSTLLPVKPLGRFSADVEPGDGSSLTCVPGVGTELALNGEAVGLIEGEEFSMPVVSTWIGKRPVDEKLGQKLLSRSRRL